MKRTFSLWLLLVVSLGFMLTVTVSHVVVSQQELANAQASMNDRLNSLERRLGLQDERVRLFVSAAKDWDVQADEAQFERFLEAYGLEAVVKDYSVDVDVVMLITDAPKKDSLILGSNDDRYGVGKELGSCFDDEEAIEGIVRSTQNGTIERIVLDTYQDDDDEMSIIADMNYVLARNLEDTTIIAIKTSSAIFANRDDNVLWITLSSFVLLAFVFRLVSRLLDRVVIKPVGSANKDLEAISNGDLDTIVDARGSLEMCSLSDGINTTVDTLRGWIDVAERRIDQELTTAKAIQSSALPSTFPPFPDIHEFDIYASMNAAKMVGGDFYDFFLIDDETVGFLIADVSGKGIPGALFMMAAKAELDNYMSTGMDLAEAIMTANFRLCAGNDAGMFVTVWAATLNYRTGLLTYVNAGHNPPLLRHDGAWTWLKQKGGLFMGTFEQAKYRSSQMTLAHGDELLLYTDGVNEAFNVNEEEYGNDRLEGFLTTHSNLHPRELVGELRKSVSAWAEGTEQSDDITIMSLEYGKAPNATGSIVIPATLEHLDEVIDFIDAELARRLCSFGAQHKIDMVLEELFVNICHYAYADCKEPGSCRVEYLYKGNPSTIAVSLIDEGVAFNPLDRAPTDNPLDAVENGGLGILLAINNADDIAYIRDGDKNVLTFTKSW